MIIPAWPPCFVPTPRIARDDAEVIFVLVRAGSERKWRVTSLGGHLRDSMGREVVGTMFAYVRGHGKVRLTRRL